MKIHAKLYYMYHEIIKFHANLYHPEIINRIYD